MENTGGQRCIGTREQKRIPNVNRGSRTATRYDGDIHRLDHLASQLEVVTAAPTVLVDARDQDFARAKLLTTPRPGNRVQLRWVLPPCVNTRNQVVAGRTVASGTLISPLVMISI